VSSVTVISSAMLTVLFATRNRAGILNEVLESYCHLQALPGGWKLVVVDNGSTDKTLDTLKLFAGRLPLQFIVESKPGKNIALNSGLELAEGGLTVLTDDDAFPRADWLVELQSAAESQPAYSMFGGVVIPRWSIPPPHWVEWVNQAAVFTLTTPSLPDGPLDPTEIYGPNMAVRTTVFASGARFDTSIGPKGSSYPMGSETELVLRLGRQGHKAWHLRQAVVEHYIREEQLRKDWVMQRAVRFGRGQYRLFGVQGANGSAVKSRPVLWRKMLKQAALMIAGRVFLQEEIAFRADWRFNYFRGEAIEARNMALERRTQSSSAPAAVRRDS
jgi:L-malate glycosyltransferase